MWEEEKKLCQYLKDVKKETFDTQRHKWSINFACIKVSKIIWMREKAWIGNVGKCRRLKIFKLKSWESMNVLNTYQHSSFSKISRSNFFESTFTPFNPKKSLCTSSSCLNWQLTTCLLFRRHNVKSIYHLMWLSVVLLIITLSWKT